MRRMSSILAAALFAGVAMAADPVTAPVTTAVTNAADAAGAATTTTTQAVDGAVAAAGAVADPKAVADTAATTVAAAADPKTVTDAAATATTQVTEAADAAAKAATDAVTDPKLVTAATGGLVTEGPAPAGSTVFVMPSFKIGEDATKPGCYTVGEATNQYALELCEKTNSLVENGAFGTVKGTLTNTGKESLCNIAFAAGGNQELSKKLQSLALPELAGAKLPTIDAPIKLEPGQKIEFGFKLPVNKDAKEAPAIGLSNQLVPCAALDATAKTATEAVNKAADDTTKAAGAAVDATKPATDAVADATKPAADAVAGATATLPKVEIDPNGVAKAGSIIQDVPLIKVSAADTEAAISPANSLSASLAGLVAVGAALFFQFAL